MIKCPYCGYETEQLIRFCPNCGRDLNKDSDSDFLVFLKIVGFFLLFIFNLVFLYYLLPHAAGVTIYMFALLLLVPLLGPIAGIPGAVIGGVCFLLSVPYWFRLLRAKFKLRLKWKQVLPYYLKWFLKGPWAYRDLKVFLDQFPELQKKEK